MSYEWFTDEWARAWGEQLSNSEAWKAAAEKWVWPIALSIQANPELNIPEERAIFLDLFQGECRAARAATADRPDRVPSYSPVRRVLTVSAPTEGTAAPAGHHSSPVRTAWVASTAPRDWIGQVDSSSDP